MILNGGKAQWVVRPIYSKWIYCSYSRNIWQDLDNLIWKQTCQYQVHPGYLLSLSLIKFPFCFIIEDSLARLYLLFHYQFLGVWEMEIHIPFSSHPNHISRAMSLHGIECETTILGMYATAEVLFARSLTWHSVDQLCACASLSWNLGGGGLID